MLVYDGDCAFCTRWAHWARRRLPPDVAVVAWQEIDDLGALGLTEADVRDAAYWIGDSGRLSPGHEAIAETLVAMGGAWRPVGRLLDAPVVRSLADAGYRLVARNRHRMPGGTPACRTDERE